MIDISAHQISTWADRVASRPEFPRLIRRLILSETDEIQHAEMPAGDGVQLPGFDGLVEATGGDPWVPAGLSAWELGANNNPRRKADDDYGRRSANPGSIDPAAATFVFVTPRTWADKEDWVHRKRAEEIWADVRVYDAQSLEAWLENREAVALWFADRLGLASPGAVAVDVFWREAAQATNPELSPAILLNGRSSEVAALHGWLESDESLLQISSESPRESALFFASALAKSSEESVQAWLSRAVVVTQEEGWRRLMASPLPLLVLLRSGDSAAVGQLVRRGHRVVVPTNPRGGSNRHVLELPRLNREQFHGALQEMGFSEAEAEATARAAGRTVAALERQLAISPAGGFPAWAEPASARLLVPALLLGGWSEDSTVDKEALEELAGEEYENYVARLV